MSQKPLHTIYRLGRRELGYLTHTKKNAEKESGTVQPHVCDPFAKQTDRIERQSCESLFSKKALIHQQLQGRMENSAPPECGCLSSFICLVMSEQKKEMKKGEQTRKRISGNVQTFPAPPVASSCLSLSVNITVSAHESNACSLSAKSPSYHHHHNKFKAKGESFGISRMTDVTQRSSR